ncbi:MAG: glutamate--tRNA ligase [Candidatus Nomurabacteria bacterium]|nr:glutamate--tRNA ligase [Candidatus Nomurabacteria bacterium]
MSDKKVITRFAPSPTGFMHVGGVRTALYAWLWAKKNNGAFILRIEDTDKEREVEGSIAHIMESLKWLGIQWDQGPDIGGPYGSYIQSERLELYKKYALKLIEKGDAYPDPYTKEQLDEFRKKADDEKRPFLYREHRPENFGIWDGTQALRFKTPEIKSYKWHDAVRGDLSAGEEALDDFILIKTDGYPTYNFAHIIDDLQMEVTHIMRADEFISSTPKFLSLYDALGITPPIFATLPPILVEGGHKKLGKRDGAKDILEYKKEGYLKETMINFLALLGWNPGGEKEIYTVDELIEAFTLERIQISGAQMNLEKLDWMNKEHIKKMNLEDLKNKIFGFLPKEYQNEKIIPVIAERIAKFSDITEMLEKAELNFFFKEPIYDKTKLIYKTSTKEQTDININNAIKSLEDLNESQFTKENVKEALMQLANALPSRGEILHPIRFALSGLDKSPDPFIIAEILGKNETISRLQKAL